MVKRNKVINMFDNNIIVKNEGVKYSDLLNDFMKPFEKDFYKVFDLPDAIEFAMNGWNFGNLKLIIPENEFQEIISDSPDHFAEGELLIKLIERKVKHFKKHDRFIADFEIKTVKNEPVLSVITQEKEQFIANLMDEMDENHPDEDFEEGYINRQAIVLKPQQPFIDWVKIYNPDFEEEEIIETKIYLVDDEIEDVEKWLRKKFDIFFRMELEDWHDNKKEWPQRRTYKMFMQWFHIETSSKIFDIEDRPVVKE